MPNFSSLAGLEVAEKFLWGGVGWGGLHSHFHVNQTVVLCCVGVGVLTTTNIIKDTILEIV